MTELPKRQLRDLTVSALGLGCMGMSAGYGVPDDAESLRTLDRALELGVNFFDTADMYGNNEDLLGGWLRGKRERVVIATKFGFLPPDPNKPGPRVSGRPEYVRQAAEKSLKRLGVDHLDLYYAHRIDPETPVEDTVGAMAELVKEGKVRYLGLSEPNPDSLRRANAVHPITAVQTEYSLWSRDVEDNGALQTCRQLGVGFVPYSPLGRGFLSGELKTPADLPEGDFRRNHPRFQGENFQKNLDLVAEIQAIATEKGCTASQLALAWVLAQGDELVPIPGTKRVKYLEENLAALHIKLTDADMARIDAAFPPGRANGTRYPAVSMGLLNG